MIKDREIVDVNLSICELLAVSYTRQCYSLMIVQDLFHTALYTKLPVARRLIS